MDDGHLAGLTRATVSLILSNVASIAGAVRDGVVRPASRVLDRQPGEGILPVLPALRPLLPAGGLAKGSAVPVSEYGLLCLALIAAAPAAGAGCRVAVL